MNLVFNETGDILADIVIFIFREWDLILLSILLLVICLGKADTESILADIFCWPVFIVTGVYYYNRFALAVFNMGAYWLIRGLGWKALIVLAVIGIVVRLTQLSSGSYKLIDKEGF